MLVREGLSENLLIEYFNLVVRLSLKQTIQKPTVINFKQKRKISKMTLVFESNYKQNLFLLRDLRQIPLRARTITLATNVTAKNLLLAIFQKGYPDIYPQCSKLLKTLILFKKREHFSFYLILNK